MKRYGLCRWSLEGGNQFKHIGDFGVSYFSDTENPVCMFFSHPDDRECVLENLMAQNPGHIYSCFEISNATMRPPGVMAEFTVDKNGFLPK